MILLLAAVYFLIPLYAALRFAGLKAFPDIFKQAGFSDAILLSLRLAIVTTILTLVLMVPTTVYVHLRLPQMRRTMEGITILPIVIPPIVLIIGVLKVAPGFLLSTPYLLALVYVILAMPFAYRSLDAGLRAIDLKTLVEASNSLGAGWPTTLWRVVLPNIRTAMLSATVLTVALVLGEFTMASLALFVTFPVWIVQFEQNSGPVSVAASLLALFVTWLLLMLIVIVGGRGARKRGGAQVGPVHRRPSRKLARPRESRNDRRTQPATPRRPPAPCTARPHRRDAACSLQDLSRSFGTTRALDGLSLEIAPGELVALLGPSGCGKTTALRIVAGFESADTGSVLVDGKDISPVPAARRDMGMVFQSYSLFPNMTALDNVALRAADAQAGLRPAAHAGQRAAGHGRAGRRRPGSTRISCPAASSSGSRWPGRWPSSRGCCCSTSRCPRWTPRCGCSCASRSARCSSGSAPPRCSSPTTRRRRCRWPTGSG